MEQQCCQHSQSEGRESVPAVRLRNAVEELGSVSLLKLGCATLAESLIQDVMESRLIGKIDPHNLRGMQMLPLATSEDRTISRRDHEAMLRHAMRADGGTRRGSRLVRV
jgi:hypothetical protein